MTIIDKPNIAADGIGEGDLAHHDDEPPTPVDEIVADALAGAVVAGSATDEYAGMISKFVRNSAHLAQSQPTALAQLIHPNFRWTVTDEGAPPEDMPVLTSPDLEVDIFSQEAIALPAIANEERHEHIPALRELLDERRAMPYYSERPMSAADLSLLLDTALGTREMLFAYNRTDNPSRRFPTAGGLQPIDTYVAAQNVEGVVPGIHRYNPVAHELAPYEVGDVRVRLIEAALQTDWLFHAPIVLIFVVNLDRVLWKYGTRGYRYAHVDTGIATMNVLLTAQAMGMFSNPVAAFDDDLYNEIMGVDGSTRFVNLLVAVGHRPAKWG